MALTTPNMALRLWNLPSDAYDSQQLADNFARLDQHDHSFGKGTQIGTAGIQDAAITGAKLAPGAVSFSIANGSVTADMLSDAARLGLTDSTSVRRGAVSIATAESTSSTSYTTLTTPDRIASVVLPANGLIMVSYQAIWQNTVANNGRAAIFIGANQLKQATGALPGVQEATGNANANIDAGLSTSPNGLISLNAITGTTEVTTGELIGLTGLGGGSAMIFAAAGTYDVSIQFKNSAAGTLTTKNRHLWVWTISF